MMGGGSAAAQGMLLATMIGIAMISFATLTPLGMTMASIFKSYFDSQKLSTPFCGACLNGQTVAYNTVDDCFDCFTEPVPTDLCGPCTTGQFIRYDATNDCLACYTVPANASISDAVYVCAGCADAQSLFYNATAACFDCATETLTCVGGGACAVADDTGAAMTLRTLVGGTNIDVTEAATEITIDATIPSDVVRTCSACTGATTLYFNSTAGCFDCANETLSCTGSGSCLVSFDGGGTGPAFSINSLAAGPNIGITQNGFTTTLEAVIPPTVIQTCGSCTNTQILVYNTTGSCYDCVTLAGDVGLQTAVVGNTLMVQYAGIQDAYLAINSTSAGSGASNVMVNRASAIYSYHRNKVTNQTMFHVEFYIDFSFSVGGDPSVITFNIGNGWPAIVNFPYASVSGTCYQSTRFFVSAFPSLSLFYQTTTSPPLGMTADNCRIVFFYEVDNNAGLP